MAEGAFGHESVEIPQIGTFLVIRGKSYEVKNVRILMDLQGVDDEGDDLDESGITVNLYETDYTVE